MSAEATDIQNYTAAVNHSQLYADRISAVRAKEDTRFTDPLLRKLLSLGRSMDDRTSSDEAVRSPASVRADEYVQYANSYTRLDEVIDCWFRRRETGLTGPEWWALLGREWSCCDNIWSASRWLRTRLRAANRQHVECMMEPEEHKALRLLPETITVYRGAHAFNRWGLSWTLSRSVAVEFPTLNRYRNDDYQASLLIGVVPRNRAVLKLDRTEFEIISADVAITSSEPITVTPQ
jgi:hypothetical protein